MNAAYEKAVSEVEGIVLANLDKFSTYDEWEGACLTSAIAEVAQHPKTATIFDILDEEDLHNFSRSGIVFTRYVARLVQLRLDMDEVIARPENLLNPPDADAGWEAGYKHAVANFLAEKAEPVQLQAGTYGWTDYDLLVEKTNGTYKKDTFYVVAVFDFKEDTWTEFEGTFVTEPHSSHYGITANAIYNDGTNRRIRWEGNIGDVIRNVTTR